MKRLIAAWVLAVLTAGCGSKVTKKDAAPTPEYPDSQPQVVPGAKVVLAG